MDINEYKLATSIWIFSCNDMPPQMTYKSLVQRIPDVELKEIKKIVSKFPELFQAEIPKKQLEEWKLQMKGGNNRSKWIAKLPNEIDPEITIDDIKSNDVFRNRFRNSNSAPPSDQEILKWGLNYLNDIYTLKDKESSRKLFSITNLIIPIISLLLVGASIYVNYNTSNRQIEIKNTAMTREIMLPHYNQFVASLSTITTKLNENIQSPINPDFKKLRKSLAELSPYLSNSEYDEILKDVQSYYDLIVKIKRENSMSQQQQDDLIDKFLNIESKVRKATHRVIDIKN